MREFVFTIEYEVGEDPLMDVFINHPKTHARTINCQVSEQDIWRLERLAGPEDALEKLDEHYTHPVYCECVGEPHCQVEWHGEIIDAEPGRRTIYCYRPEPGDCHSVPRLATDCQVMVFCLALNGVNTGMSGDSSFKTTRIFVTSTTDSNLKFETA